MIPIIIVVAVCARTFVRAGQTKSVQPMIRAIVKYPVIGHIQHTLSRSGGWHHGHRLNSVIAMVGRVKFYDFRKNLLLRVSPILAAP